MRRASAKLRVYLRGKEKLRLAAYLDTGDVPTIGYGHTQGVKLGDTCTPEQAEVWLDGDLAIAEGEVNEQTKDLPLTQGMFDCLVSFEFNTGGLRFLDGRGRLVESQVLRALKDGRWADAGEELIRWNIDNREALRGLFIRRCEELLHFYASEPWPG